MIRATAKLTSVDKEKLLEVLLVDYLSSPENIEKIKTKISNIEPKSSVKFVITQQVKDFYIMFVDITGHYGYQKPKITKALLNEVNVVYDRVNLFYKKYIDQDLTDKVKLSRFHKIFAYIMMSWYSKEAIKSSSVITLVCKNKANAFAYLKIHLDNDFPGYIGGGMLKLILNTDDYIYQLKSIQ
jgi:hypothetical protein